MDAIKMLIEIEIKGLREALGILREKYDRADANHAPEQVEVMQEITKTEAQLTALENLLKKTGGG